MKMSDVSAPLVNRRVLLASLRVIIPVVISLALFILSVFFLLIPGMERQMMSQQRNMIRNLTDTCWSLLNVYQERVKSGELSLHEAQARVLERLRGMRYGPEGKDYFWINDMTPQLLMHPYRPDLEGKDLSQYADARGKRLFQEFIKAARDGGAGYVDYTWQWKDDPSRMLQKISYVRSFEPWGWVIGTGMYTEDVRADIAAISHRMVITCSGVLIVVLGLSMLVIWQTVRTETARTEAERGLMEREEVFRALGDEAPFGISVIGKDQRYEYVNPEFTRIFGYDLSDIPDKQAWYEKAYPDPVYREKVIAAWMEDVMAQSVPEGPKPRIFRVRCKNGQDKTIYFRAVAMKNGKYLLTSQDITEQDRMERSLRESEQRYLQLYEESKRGEELYRSLIHSSADAIVIYDIEGNAQYVSPAFTRIFGWTMEEVQGKRIPFLPESEREGTMAVIRELVDHGTPCHGFETKRHTKDGQILDVSISASRYDDHEGKPAGMLVILRDISERKNLEAQFYEAQKMESVGTLAGGVAHDFNNLLMAIQGNVSLLLLDTPPQDPGFKRLQNIEQHVQRGAYLTRQLLGFARGGKYEIKMTDLNEIVRRSADLFSRMKKEIKIHSTLEPDIWMVEADQGQMEQVLMNLYVNAGHAMPNGGDLFVATEDVTLARDQAGPLNLKQGQYVKISVADTGVGMDPGILPKIFDPFFTTRKVGDGTGLGLASAYGIVKNHGGAITVKSAKGEGSTFEIYLPAAQKEAGPSRPKTDADSEMASGGETVLLVDDEDMVIEVGQEMLQRLGYTVLTAMTGREAIETYRAHKDLIDLVILDMIMPDMAGMETYDRLRKEDPKIIVLLSSGYSIDGQASEILRHGCNGFIQKPFTMAALSQKVRQVLGKTNGEG